jgi:hypothetical protein
MSFVMDPNKTASVSNYAGISLRDLLFIKTQFFLKFTAPLGTHAKFVHRTFAKYSLERKEKQQPELRALLAIVFLVAIEE